MRIKEKKEDGLDVLVLSGDMTADAMDSLRAVMKRLLGDGRNRVVLNLKNVRQIDSSGIGAIVFLLKRCRASGGDVKLFAPSRHVESVLNMVGLHRSLEIIHDEKAGLALSGAFVL